MRTGPTPGRVEWPLAALTIAAPHGRETRSDARSVRRQFAAEANTRSMRVAVAVADGNRKQRRCGFAGTERNGSTTKKLARRGVPKRAREESQTAGKGAKKAARRQAGSNCDTDTVCYGMRCDAMRCDATPRRPNRNTNRTQGTNQAHGADEHDNETDE